ncbi:MAG TPA: hypothetical protein VIV11_20010, partial [Kofleriaceae bacterium]
MKTVLTAAVLTMTLATPVFAQPAEPAPNPADCCPPLGQAPAAPQLQPQPDPQQVAALTPDTQPALTGPSAAPIEPIDDEGWRRPVGRRFLHGFRIGWTYLFKMNDSMYKTRTDEAGNPVTIGEKYGLKSPNMMLLGYEGFYRIIGHSWLNVLLVGNVSVAGLEQSKFIPAASGLIGFEFDRSFQVGVGVNLT